MQSNWIYVIGHYSLFFCLRLQKYKNLRKRRWEWVEKIQMGVPRHPVYKAIRPYYK